MDRVELSTQYEILFLPSGDIYLSHIYGSNLCVRQPPEAVRWYLRRLDVVRDPLEALSNVEAKFGRSAAHQAKAIYEQLRATNVFRPAPIGDDSEELVRFRSQIAWLAEYFPDYGGYKAFRRIRCARVACIGAGGAGSQRAVMLAAAGIGKITLIDGDHVSETNLTRQPYYSELDAREKVPKVHALAAHIRRLTSYTLIETRAEYLRTDTAVREALADHDLILMTADSPRILVNRLIGENCVRLRIPLLYAFFGQIGPMYVPDKSPCFACLESTWRQEAGDEYDSVIEALQIRPTREYPSLISGPVQIADAMFLETLAFITNAFVPQTLGAVLRLNRSGHERRELRPRERCKLCGFR